MLEYPEVITTSKLLNEVICGKIVTEVLPPVKLHKFCWFNGDPNMYDSLLSGVSVIGASGFGIFVEIDFSNGKHLCFNDGVRARFFVDDSYPDIPNNYQLKIRFSDGSCLVFTVTMYGGLYLHDGDYDNEYYIKSRNSFSPESKEFHDSFYEQMETCKKSMSAKAFLATDQHFPGIGNGVIQDILFAARINPRQTISSLDPEKKDTLFSCTVKILDEMISHGGRNTEVDIFGNPGSYKALMSKETLSDPCPCCGATIVKEAYLGGSVYYCPVCQPVPKRSK